MVARVRGKFGSIGPAVLRPWPECQVCYPFADFAGCQTALRLRAHKFNDLHNRFDIWKLVGDVFDTLTQQAFIGKQLAISNSQALISSFEKPRRFKPIKLSPESQARPPMTEP